MAARAAPGSARPRRRVVPDARPRAGRSARRPAGGGARGPVTRDEAAVGGARRARSRRAAARAGHGAGAAAGRDRGAPVRPLALQRASAVLRLHHRLAGADRHPRRPARGGAERQRRRARPVAGGDRGRSADRPLDRAADRLPDGVRRADGQRRQHGQPGVLLGGARGAGRLGRPPGGDRRGGVAAAARLRIRRDAHLDPEGRRSLRPRHGVDPLDSRRTPISGWTSTRCAAPSRPTSPPAIVRSWSSAPPARSAPARSIRCRRSRRSAASTASGSTSTAPTAGSPPRAEDAPADLAGIGLADSIAVDPHKWLYAPLEAGCALVRDAEHLRAAFAYHPPYYHFDERVTNYVDYGPQNSRGFRALKVWLALRQVGASGYRTMIGDDMRLARALADAVRRTPELELLMQSLSITTFRYVPAELRRADRRSGGRRAPRRDQPRAARSAAARRRAVRLERRRRRPLRAARVHRELPDDGGGHRRDPGDRRPRRPRRRGRVAAATASGARRRRR